MDKVNKWGHVLALHSAGRAGLKGLTTSSQIKPTLLAVGRDFLCAPSYLSCFFCLHFTAGTSCHSSLCAMPCSPLLFHSPGPQALFSYLANSSHVISLSSEEWFSDLQTCTDLCHHGDPLALLSLFGDLPTPLGIEALDDSDLWIPYSQSSVKNGLSVNIHWRNGFLLL